MISTSKKMQSESDSNISEDNKTNDPAQASSGPSSAADPGPAISEDRVTESGSTQKRDRPYREEESEERAAPRPRVEETGRSGGEEKASADDGKTGQLEAESGSGPVGAGGNLPYPAMAGIPQESAFPSSLLSAQSCAALAMGMGQGGFHGMAAQHFSPMGSYYGQQLPPPGSSSEGHAQSGRSGEKGISGQQQQEGVAAADPSAASGSAEAAGLSSQVPSLAASYPALQQQMISMSQLGGAFSNAALLAATRAQLARAAAALPSGTLLGSAGNFSGAPVNTSVPLALPCDADNLSEYQLLIRKQLEVFEAGADDVDSNMQGRKKSIRLGQVGIRCRHCVHLPLRNRGRGAVYYPTKLQGIYQAAQNMASTHLTDACNVINDEMKAEMKRLRERRDTASGGKQYWADGARALGLYETEDGGIRMHRGGAATGTSTTATSSESAAPS
jgi:hypothetical protein